MKTLTDCSALGDREQQFFFVWQSGVCG